MDSHDDNSGMLVPVTSEVAELFCVQEDRLQARLGRATAQRQMWLQQQEQLLMRVAHQQRDMDVRVSTSRRTAERQQQQLDAVIQSLSAIMKEATSRPQTSKTLCAQGLNAPPVQPTNGGDSAVRPAKDCLAVDATGAQGQWSFGNGEEDSKLLGQAATHDVSRLTVPSQAASRSSCRTWRSSLWSDEKDTHLGHFITSTTFDAVCATVICINACTMGYAAQDEMDQVLERLRATGPLATISAEGLQSNSLRLLSYSFSAFYALELFLKLKVFRLRFFCNEDKLWNLLDTFLLLTAVYDIVLDIVREATGFRMNMTWMRVLRLLKMLKMLRMVRVMKFFRELRIMLYSIVGSVRTLFWSILMLMLIMYIFGLCFLQAVTGYLLDTEPELLDPDLEEAMLEHWGSVHASMLTLCKAITGGDDWSDLASPLKATGMHYYLLFLFYIAFLVFAVLNVLTGIFVDQALQIAQLDRDNVIKEEMEREKLFVRNLQKIFSTIDSGGTGYISWSQFQKHREDEWLKAYFAVTDIDISQAETFFALLDNDSGETVDIDEFITGCTKLRGGARSIDLVTLKHNTKLYMRQVRQFMDYVEDWFDKVHHRLEDWGVKKPEPLRMRLMKARGVPAQVAS